METPSITRIASFHLLRVSYFRSLATAFSAYVLLYVWVFFPPASNCQILLAGLMQISRQSRRKQKVLTQKCIRTFIFEIEMVNLKIYSQVYTVEKAKKLTINLKYERCKISQFSLLLPTYLANLALVAAKDFNKVKRNLLAFISFYTAINFIRP